MDSDDKKDDISFITSRTTTDIYKNPNAERSLLPFLIFLLCIAMIAVGVLVGYLLWGVK